MYIVADVKLAKIAKKEEFTMPEKNNVPLCDQEVDEKILNKQGCAELDPVRGCVPRSGKCDPRCPEKKRQEQNQGCGGPICFKS